MNDHPFDLPWDKPPLHVNELGVKFWIDESSTRYARREDLKGTTLPTAVVFFTEHPDGERTRLLTIDNAAVVAKTSLEDLAVEIDKIKAIKRCTG